MVPFTAAWSGKITFRESTVQKKESEPYDQKLRTDS